MPNIWGLGQVEDTKFGTNASNKILRLQNAKVTALTVSEFIKGKPTGGGGGLNLTLTSPPTQIRVKTNRKTLRSSKKQY